ncbi:unnamed protein product [Paramecium octaurelia]|uniref:Uncharacterized protein n=1 Tax=Paramecium octaurelia TaxID=43137 RepID=A0A8S1WX99_PAROT|nr:unnamed protein product [Paramecium octaurelia]
MNIQNLEESQEIQELIDQIGDTNQESWNGSDNQNIIQDFDEDLNNNPFHDKQNITQDFDVDLNNNHFHDNQNITQDFDVDLNNHFHDNQNITQDFDVDQNPLFREEPYLTFIHQYEHQYSEETQKLPNESYIQQLIDDVKEINEFEIEYSFVLTINQVENISTFVEHYSSQKEYLIETQMSQLLNNKTLLKGKIVLHDEKDLEIITMLIMLLIKYNPNPRFFLKEQEEQLDMHMKKLFEILTSYQDYCQATKHGGCQNQDQIKQEIEITLEKGFTTQLLKKLDDQK